VADRVAQLARRLPGPVWRVLGPTYRAYSSVSSRRRFGDEGASDVDSRGVPVPPPGLRRLVTGWNDREEWLRSGEVDAGLIRALVESRGPRLEEMEALLDLGCGCGRVARWWRDLEGPAVYGCDYNRELVRWCQENLGFLTARHNRAKPPLPFEAGTFDLVYGISLFSHLRAEQQVGWLAEVRRVLRPGGLFLFTVMGDRFRSEMSEGEGRRFSQGELVVRNPAISGTNRCSVFHPPQFVRGELLAPLRFELLEFVDEDRSGQERSVSPLPLQDNYLVRAPGSP
jgi:SAM-dependent methyltransferase